MKRKLLLLLSLVAILSACTDSYTVDSVDGGSRIDFYADFDSKTRIEFTDENIYAWEGDETLGVYLDSATPTVNSHANLILTDGVAKCWTTTKYYAAGDRMYVYYPWDEHNDMNSLSELSLTLPVHQKQSEAGCFTVENMPMASSAVTLDISQSTPTVYMRPLAGFLRINVYSSQSRTKESVLSVEYCDEDTPMAGNFSLDMRTVAASGEIVMGKCSSNMVAVSVATPYLVTESPKGNSIYLVLAPGSYEGELTITTNKAIYRYNYTRTVERNRYYDVNIDLSKATSYQTLSSTWGGGDGSKESPFLISTGKDLALLSELINETGAGKRYLNKHYRQICDIDMTGVSMAPISKKSELAFKGSYDGNGYTIEGVELVPADGSGPCALFGYTSEAELKGVTVKNFVIGSTDKYQAALVGHATNTTITDCQLEGKIKFYNLYSGGLVGYMSSGYLSSCRVNGLVENDVKGNNTAEETNVAYTAGFVGHAIDGALIENCTLSGDVATMGRYAAGIVARVENATIRGCSVLNTAEISNVSNYCGGIVAIMVDNNSLIESCRFEGRVNTSYPIAGAIVGSMTAGKVYNCLSTKNSIATSYEGYSGGIAGQIYTATATDVAIIDNCSAYGQVEGAYNVGGIVGYVRHSQKGAYAGITNCAVLGSTLISRGANSYGYNLVGGIAGWLHGDNNTVVIANCVARPKEIHGAPVSKSVATKEIIAGLVACPNIDDIHVEACYTDITRDNLLVGFEQVKETAGTIIRHGTLFGYAYNSCSFSNCYSLNSLPMHGSWTTGKNIDVSRSAVVTLTQMTDGTLLAKLNEAAAAYVPMQNTPAAVSWTTGTDGYPVPANLPIDTTPINAEPKKVSVIGDSISTFRGYIPYSYSTYYPRTDGTFLSVADMYWYHLIYKHMANARLERNIAYSGSWVTNASASEKTYFARRFMDQNGVGDADIVLIHGGTNDWNKKAVSLVDDVSIRSTTAPTDTQMAPIFAAADAATTRAEIEALNDQTFCQAYIKLIKLIIDRNPDVKVVCIIGDYVGVGVQLAIHKIADHFTNCRCVDLRAVNGFNDQTYMPKLYYSETNTGQCHPNQQAMAFIGEKIYKELGEWLED